MDVAAGNEMGSAPLPRSRNTVSLRRIALPEALGRVAAISLVIAILIFAGLTLQMSLGGDPALGPKVSRQSAPSAGQGSQTTTASTGSDDTTAITAALAAQAEAQTQLTAPAQTSAPAPTAVPATPSPPPTPVQTSTS
jgi:hypothetical protein